MQGHYIYSHFINYHYSNIFIPPEGLKGRGEWVPIWGEGQPPNGVLYKFHMWSSPPFWWVQSHGSRFTTMFSVLGEAGDYCTEEKPLWLFSLLWHGKCEEPRATTRFKFDCFSWKHVGNKRAGMLWPVKQRGNTSIKRWMNTLSS